LLVSTYDAAEDEFAVTVNSTDQKPPSKLAGMWANIQYFFGNMWYRFLSFSAFEKLLFIPLVPLCLVALIPALPFMFFLGMLIGFGLL